MLVGELAKSPQRPERVMWPRRGAASPGARISETENHKRKSAKKETRRTREIKSIGKEIKRNVLSPGREGEHVLSKGGE